MVTATADRRSTILVVEDEAGIARMIQVLLEARGFVAVVCHSGDDALQRVRERRVDLVLLDVMMPGMDGYEVCRRLKADQRHRHIPVVMLTAKDAVRDMVLGLEIGADDYISKPFSPKEVTSVMAKIGPRAIPKFPPSAKIDMPVAFLSPVKK